MAITNLSKQSTDWILYTGASAQGTGGTITPIGSDRVHKFDASGTFTPVFPANVRALVVAGGGGGASAIAGGGGAGGLLASSEYALAFLDSIKKVKRIRFRISASNANTGTHFREFDVRDANNVRILNTAMVLTTGVNNANGAVSTAVAGFEIDKAFDGNNSTTHWDLGNVLTQSASAYKEGIFTLNTAVVLSSVSAITFYEANRIYYRYELDVQYEGEAGTNSNGSDGTWTNVVVSQTIGDAGGTLLGATKTVTNSIPVTVGTGGTGGTGGGNGTAGANSVFSTLTAIGGGNGSSGAGAGGAGGSGGGARSNTAGTGTSGQGNNGGISSATNGTSGGGGGAGAVGATAVGSSCGAGGAGLSSDITGTATFYAGGGGGGGYVQGPTTAGAGGNGGGGAGGLGAAGTAGATNKGSGGGGGGYSNAPVNYAGGAGGSGVVIIRYTIPANAKKLHTDKFISI